MQSVPATLRKDDLIALALSVREAVMHLRPSLATAAREYPNEGQAALTRLLAMHLGFLGHEALVSESTDRESVLLAGRSVVDLTFKGEFAPLVDVSRQHSQKGPFAEALSGVADTESYLQDLSLIQAFLARPKPDLRLQPFVPALTVTTETAR